ncbi:hypothetical protein RintRC_3166 [Richelia intracellularis]|nr:hypothetical protein RintRC_3166 [Richelia intracellularis]
MPCTERYAPECDFTKLTPQQRKPVDSYARYLLNNAKYLKYHHYLKARFPIPTGVIEGACRHLIKDRMDIIHHWG